MPSPLDPADAGLWWQPPEPGRPGLQQPWSPVSPPAVQRQPTSYRKAGRTRRAAAIAMAVALLMVCVGAALATRAVLSSLAQGPSPAVAASLAAEVAPDIVDLYAQSTNGSQAAGTGIVLTSTGEVLTNAHVVATAQTLEAVDIGDGQSYTATVVGADHTQDIAVLQLAGASDLHTVGIESDPIGPFAQVVGIGNAGGQGGAPAYAGGVVTGLDRSFSATADDGGTERLGGLIQTNCDILPGDSGGPLVDVTGKVIGIDTAGATSNGPTTSNPESFAIPIATAMQIAHQIQAGTVPGTS